MKAFVLHSRPYRETSVIVELFTEQGRLGVVAQGARNSKKYRMSLLQPFIPLLVSVRGKSELQRLESVEAVGAPFVLQGKKLFSGLYMNELLLRALSRDEHCKMLFDDYQHALTGLTENQEMEPLLRQFEKKLLADLGFALLFIHFQDKGYYRFEPGSGFFPADSLNRESAFLGSHLNAIAQDDYSDKSVLRSAKQLMRLALSEIVGKKPLKSRELFLNREG